MTTEYVLPLVVRVERATPPDRTDALEAAARAVLAILSDPSDEWAEAIATWEAGRIRKVVRRARGAAWQRALAQPGITVTWRTAEVRVYPPIPVDAWPPDLAKLQVAGTEFETQATPQEPTADLPVLWLNPDLPMTAGKAMAQVGHAAQLAWWRLSPAARSLWRERGFGLAVRTATESGWKELAASDRPVVRDGGFTEVPPGSSTVIADLPTE